MGEDVTRWIFEYLTDDEVEESDNEEEGARKAEGLEPVQEGSEHSSSSDDAGYAKSDAEEEEVAVKRTLEIQDSVPVTQERKHSDTGSVTSSSSSSSANS